MGGKPVVWFIRSEGGMNSRKTNSWRMRRGDCLRNGWIGVDERLCDLRHGTDGRRDRDYSGDGLERLAPPLDILDGVYFSLSAGRSGRIGNRLSGNPLVSYVSAGIGVGSTNINPYLINQAFIVVLFFGLMGGLYPAWRASRLQSIDVLRYK